MILYPGSAAPPNQKAKGKRMSLSLAHRVCIKWRVPFPPGKAEHKNCQSRTSPWLPGRNVDIKVSDVIGPGSLPPLNPGMMEELDAQIAQNQGEDSIPLMPACALTMLMVAACSLKKFILKRNERELQEPLMQA